MDGRCNRDRAIEIEQFMVSAYRKGGEPFVARISELYSLMKLNNAHIYLANLQKVGFMADMMASDALDIAIRSTNRDFWLSGFRWLPTDVHKAKLGYQRALFFRLQGNQQSIPCAVNYIEHAPRLLPDDAAIAKTRATILAWSDSTL
ncbi:uncharacterized protein CC84DRAFT_66174 [Paraphaeosphaeria sporulosa]|uniref:Uncharacterized protein n=1 Tax=Paraphaeosphaeria sporulosa TaxID=1460663 RepID=A0A177CZ19_9PLEO|nr:uncharacterized protein CC84DRAFT_66174 [Paraphaeosphaeria sporulosa]OAG12080.1 hypothetical protein CC84DRAFT_66174 [Paraphaeosphaeria sporulosa]